MHPYRTAAPRKKLQTHRGSKFTAAAFALGMVAIGASTGATCQKQQAVAGDVGQLVQCVLTHASTDADPNFETIAAECGGVAVTTVVEIITAVLTSETPPDAGVAPTPATLALKKVHHK
jgi:hypothetical protein